MISKIGVLIFLLPLCCISQTFVGRVIAKVSQEPLETVAVYFDNTTIGSTTNENGEFSITYSDAIQSTLVISYLGYEKVFITDYRTKNDVIIHLKEAVNELDVVFIDADDGMPRAQKLKWFRNEFLGRSENAKSCKILNEKDLKFRYNKRDRTLIAWSNKPVLVKNKKLQYELTFDIIDFEIVIGNWTATSVIYTGTSFYKELNKSGRKRVLENRKQAYDGSVQHFMRALYNKELEEKGYIFGKEGFKVNPYDFFSFYDTDAYGNKTVILKEKLDIFYKDLTESVIETSLVEFKVDKYGNYSPIPDVLFGGNMGSQRLGDSLPLDYELNN